MTTAWTREHVTAIRGDEPETPRLTDAELVPAIPGLYLWDSWPIRRPDGSVPMYDGEERWVALAAPRTVTPIERHDLARLHLLSHRDGAWRDLGPLLPDGAGPGSREWAGSTMIDGDRLRVSYTAAGIRGESSSSFVQRMFEVTGEFDGDRAHGWGEHREMLEQPVEWYRSTLEQTSGEPGFIKAFRDPDIDVDPATGAETMLFAASLADSTTGFDGAVGIATRPGPGAAWTPGPPLLHADGVNNEMERPHLLRHGGLVYLFFSTQARTFHPDVVGPTGLYGFVADAIDGDWTPLNGSGLVLRNPVAEPFQCYSWLVYDGGLVTAFVDMPRLDGRDPDEVEAAGDMGDHFVGTPAPFLRLHLDGDRTRVAG